jgi:hypothetical protein
VRRRRVGVRQGQRTGRVGHLRAPFVTLSAEYDGVTANCDIAGATQVAHLKWAVLAAWQSTCATMQ